MNKTGIGLLVAAAWLTASAVALAQPAPGAAAGATEGAEPAPAEGGEGATPAEGGEGATPAEGEEPAEGGGDEGGLAQICEIDPDSCPRVDFKKEAARDLGEQIYAVQQLFALRVRRFEVNPYWSLTLNDQFVSHPAPGLSLNYYFDNLMAVGANFNYYRPFNVDSEFNAVHRRAARVGVPLTEYDWGASLNFTWVPVYGKFAGFQDFIFHYDAYVVGGVGAISTRPIVVMDPDNRNFDFKPKVSFVNPGIGLRIFFNRWFAAVMEVRDYVYMEELESLDVSATAPQDESTWLQDSPSLTNHVQAQLGISIFLPPSFEYRLPK